MTRRVIALAHGGAEGDTRDADGPQRAAQVAVDAMRSGADALHAVVEAVRILEDDPRFNAGHGSNVRLDGRTIHMDAALLDSTGRVASVVGLHDVRNPILVARDLLDAPNPVLAGQGASRFARRMGHAPFDPVMREARARAQDIARRLGTEDDCLPATSAYLERFWNYETAPVSSSGALTSSASGADTVGAIAHDGRMFAAAGSTGGLVAVLDGRVSDIALPGCGIDANGSGAVCVSGSGDAIIRARVASRVLALLDRGAGAGDAARAADEWLPSRCGLAVLALTPQEDGAWGRTPFPWARAVA